MNKLKQQHKVLKTEYAKLRKAFEQQGLEMKLFYEKKQRDFERDFAMYYKPLQEFKLLCKAQQQDIDQLRQDLQHSLRA